MNDTSSHSTPVSFKVPIHPGCHCMHACRTHITEPVGLYLAFKNPPASAGQLTVELAVHIIAHVYRLSPFNTPQRALVHPIIPETDSDSDTASRTKS